MRRTARRSAAAISSALSAYAATAAHGQVTFSIDPTQGKTAVSPLIYGVNPDGTYATANTGLSQPAYARLNLTSERLGGNRWTAYNYLDNASNAGSDFQYYNDNYLGGGAAIAGAVLPFVQSAAANAASPTVTVPINGYVSADESGPTGSSTPPAQSSHFVPEYPTKAADPAPAAGHVYPDGFVKLVAAAYPGTAAWPLAFMLDNEPDLWNSSHPEVHPAEPTYAELLGNSVGYATMIKSVAPTAMVYGTASYGWDGYQTLQDAPDAAANGNFINYYLKGMATASAAANTRLLDAPDLHWYPEAPNANGSDRITDDSTAPDIVAARLQAPRSLWDQPYGENSYIAQSNGPIRLIPSCRARSPPTIPAPSCPSASATTAPATPSPADWPWPTSSASSASTASTPPTSGRCSAASRSSPARPASFAATTARTAPSATPKSRPSTPTLSTPASTRPPIRASPNG